MANYVDGFIVPVPKANVEAYRRMARKAGKIWRSTARWTTRNASRTTCSRARSPRSRRA